MDPVAQQFIDQLDAAREELPGHVQAGLLMCGDDVVPALVERLADPSRPIPTRAFSAQVLAELRTPEGWRAMAEVAASGDIVLFPLLARCLTTGGVPAAEALMAQAEDPSRIAEVRLALAGVAVRAAGVDWASERASRLAIELYPVAPGPSLSLMKMVPSPAYRELLRAKPDGVRANPEAALEVLMASEPTGEGRMLVEALAKGMDRAVEDVMTAVRDGLADPASLAGAAEPGSVRDEP